MDPTENTAAQGKWCSSTSSIGAKHSGDETQHVYYGPCTSENANYSFTIHYIYGDHSASSSITSMVAQCVILSTGVLVSDLNSMNLVSDLNSMNLSSIMSDDNSINNSIAALQCQAVQQVPFHHYHRMALHWYKCLSLT